MLTPQPMISKIQAYAASFEQKQKNSCYKLRVSLLDDGSECLVQGWRTRGSLPGFMRLFFTCFVSSINILVLLSAAWF